MRLTGSSVTGGSLADGRYTLCYYDTSVKPLHRLIDDLDYNSKGEIAHGDEGQFNMCLRRTM